MVREQRFEWDLGGEQGHGQESQWREIVTQAEFTTCIRIHSWRRIRVGLFAVLDDANDLVIDGG